MDYTYLTLILVSLTLSAFFSGIEIAFISSDKLQIELQSQKGYYPAKVLAGFLKKPSRFIGTTLVGNTLSLVVYGAYMANVLDPWLEANLPPMFQQQITLLLIQTVLATLLVLAVAEFTPKSIFLLDPNRLLNVFAVPMRIFYILLWPFVRIVVWLSKIMITYVFRVPYSENQPVFGLTDLNQFVATNAQARTESGDNVQVDTKIFNNALEFKTIKVRDCMIPRTEVKAVDVQDDIDVLRQAFVDSGHSKILVYREHIDDIIGYCHSLEMFKKPREIKDIVNSIIIVPETGLANELLIQFITERKSIALVVDEFGGTSGIVTIEDIIEEIFGEIQDEHDDEDWIEQELSHNVFRLSARHEIDYLNDKYGWGIPDGDYETLGGFILSVTEDLPTKGDIITSPPFTITIESMRGTRIDVVQLTTNPALLQDE